jgi:hypothetical protein
MKLSELIAAVGDEKVAFQNLDQSAISLDWSRKGGGRITFGTTQTIIPGEGTAQLGLVVWLDRTAVAAALNPAESPRPQSKAQPSAGRDARDRGRETQHSDGGGEP